MAWGSITGILMSTQAAMTQQVKVLHCNATMFHKYSNNILVGTQAAIAQQVRVLQCSKH